MPKVILVCGKISSGKTFYAQKLRVKNQAVLLSVDEIMLDLFNQHLGADHDMVVERTRKYLFRKSAEIIETGINVILDWGFWTKADRILAKQFYEDRHITCELHYLDISDDTWKMHLSKRKAEIKEGKTNAYLVDENLIEKFNAIFEPPDKSEIDVWYEMV